MTDYIPLRKRRFGLLPAGELHDWARCAFCGRRGENGRELHRTILVSTHAPASVCKDVQACLRRRRRRAA